MCVSQLSNSTQRHAKGAMSWKINLQNRHSLAFMNTNQGVRLEMLEEIGRLSHPHHDICMYIHMQF